MSDSLLFVAEFIRDAQQHGYSPTEAELAVLRSAKEMEKARLAARPTENPVQGELE